MKRPLRGSSQLARFVTGVRQYSLCLLACGYISPDYCCLLTLERVTDAVPVSANDYFCILISALLWFPGYFFLFFFFIAATVHIGVRGALLNYYKNKQVASTQVKTLIDSISYEYTIIFKYDNELYCFTSTQASH